MKETFFINEAFTYAINSYLSYKQTSDTRLGEKFMVSFLQGLCFIYGELDILVPYQTGNALLDGGLFHNLAKYGYPQTKIQKMFQELQDFYDLEKNRRPLNPKIKNPYFVALQRRLIDMFILKYHAMHLDLSYMDALEDYLYFPDSISTYKKSLNTLLAEDPNEVFLYYRAKRMSLTSPISLEEVIYNPLPLEIYSYFHVDKSLVEKMNQHQIDEINAPILQKLHLNISDLAFHEKVLKALELLKNPQAPLTSGNGKVDLLLLISFIATELMILLFIGIRLLG